MTEILTVLSGSLVGVILGLVGGGGSILAVPLLVYVVGVDNPHVAIGTSALAVAASALANVFGHARHSHVRWPCALVFAGAGIFGAIAGATFGKMVDGQRLLTLFGVLMLIVGASMLRRQSSPDNIHVVLNRATARDMLPKLIATGLLVGALSGFFGIGGGFLIVPGLIAATAMPLIDAIGSSLVSVAAFGLTTSASYALAGLIAWKVAALFIAGGVIGSFAGVQIAKHLAERKRVLRSIFSAVVIMVGGYVVYRGLNA